ncbi:MAG TPA: aspartate aminotransferase family protein [Vicinamibacteria bacterium]|jgi:4-aminobutyrate aminotransferase-like enzyme|nr:aspartate aminotransferase family protein [Vicinamibacteria bacterium]
MDSKEIIEKYRKLLYGLGTYYKEPLPFVRGEGKWLWDAEGKKYLDFFGGIVTVSLGHCEPRVVAAIEKQIRTLQHVSTLFPTVPIVELAETLVDLFPGHKPAKVFFTNSGTEAIETAILTARVHTQRTEIIGLRHGYHGRSMLSMSLTAHAGWRLGGVHDPSIRHAVAPYCYRCPLKLSYPECGVACAEDVADVIRTTTSGRPAAFIAEPILGVGGFITPPKEYPGIVAEIVRKHEGLYIADEVQTGWGRTGGKWFGIEQYGVKPDIIVAAKSLANGHPIGATVARAEVADSFKGLTIATFGGNPVTMVAAKAVVDAIASDRLLDNATAVGAHLRSRLEKLQEKHALVGEVRGMGLMQGVELVKDRKSKEPAAQATAAVMEAAKDRGLIIGKGGLYGNVLRISPALNVSAADADQAADILDQALAGAATV